MKNLWNTKGELLKNCISCASTILITTNGDWGV